MNRQELERPFDAHLIRTRKGNQGKILSYVPSAEYVTRLNQASTNGAWNWEVLEFQILDDEVLVLGKLTIDGTTKTAFGGSSITRARDDNRVISLASDLKSASSDALKRCSMRLGLGLHLYTGATANTAQTANTANTDQSTQQREPRLVPRPNTESPNSKGRITQKQLSAIWNMGRSLGLSAEAIRVRCQETFNCSPETMDKVSASAYITALGEDLDNNRSRGAA
jgi:hypothetical protein